MYQRDADRVANSSRGMLTVIALAALAGCGGQPSSPPAVQPVSQSTVSPQQVNVSPATVQVPMGSSYQFSVTVVPASAVNTVNWSVSGAGCSGATCGSVDSTGLYSAPPSVPSPATVQIIATSTVDQTRGGGAQVTVVSQPPDFHFVGSMTVPRWNSTAILLPNGKVLILGGEQSGSSAELYNPATGTFQASSAIVSGIPLLLNTGEVLIVGGNGPTLYDPRTDSSASTGNLHINEKIIAATMLANGKALVVGLDDAEVYDPTSGSFSSTGPYAAALGSVMTSAIGLADGRALILGSSPPQLFNPATNSFSATGSLSGTELEGIDLYSATLLQDGRVLVAGGMGNGRTDAAVTYDPANGTFTATGSMNDARDDHAAVLLHDGRALVLGGDGWNCSGAYCYYSGSLSSAELYDPATGSFSRAGYMNQVRTGPTATVLQNGDVLITGGLVYCGIACGGNPTASAEIYHPE